MVYADEQYYTEKFLLGRKPRLPLLEFEFWERQARSFIDQYTFDRIDEEALSLHGAGIADCACALAEYLYLNEGNENKASESISGRSATYLYGTEYKICQRFLGMTGLMYRGSS